MPSPCCTTVVNPITNERKQYYFDDCVWSCNPKDENYMDNKQFYNKSGPDLLTHLFEGFNVCLLAYGQTSSGKTYTMMGEDESPGVIPSLIKDILKQMEISVSQKVQCELRFSYVEIYNEQVMDLLNKDQNVKCRVRENPQTGPYVENVKEAIVSSYEQFLELLKLGNKVRSTASTLMNELSSRSHAVITLTLLQTRYENEAEGGIGNASEQMTSNIKLVDLAGSERLAKTKLYGQQQRMKEGASINKSLTVLGRCINLLAQKSTKSIIPYRDSILTYLLKENLGGNCKTCMLFCISPLDYDETTQTLTYASEVKKIKTLAKANRTKLPTVPVNWDELKNSENSVIDSLRSEVETLTNKLTRLELEKDNLSSKSESTLVEQEETSNVKRLMEYLEKESARAKFENRYLKQHLAKRDKQITELQSQVDFIYRFEKTKVLLNINLPPTGHQGITSEMDTLFHSSVQEAVQLTIQNHKPLFVFLASSESTTNDTFLNKFIGEQTVSRLREKTVPLKLVQGSIEFGYFEQLFKNLIVPSFYIVSQGKLQTVVTLDFSNDNFDRCIAQLSAGHNDSGNTSSSTATNTTTTTTTTTPSLTTSSQMPPTAQTSTGDRSVPHPSSAHTTGSQMSTNAHPTTDDEHEQSVLRHRRVVEQQRQEKLAEKQRLRELVEADRRERQSREREEKESVVDGVSPVLQGSSRKSGHTNCLLAIKLFNGSTIKQDFKPDDTLVTVRAYLDEEVKIIPSTSNMPSFASTTYPTGYSFHRPSLPRITYSEEQESQSLADLDLTPRSILILKPTYDQTQSNKKESRNAKVGVIRSVYNFVMGIGRALYSFFDYGVDDVQRQISTESPAAPHQEDEILDLHQPIAPGVLSLGDRGLSSSLISLERDEATPLESRASSPRPTLSRVQTIHDEVRDTLRDTYNGNSINLRDDDQDT
ncbi:hypothetical protein KGF57_000477 [Candida theae]|uniref:Kinesin motor domain-containing protein n=1 Tax=Candida theae TaxID=1198502 RepID=A0AAD5BIW5_9ASCO|nr:uncharacterized protein KGF57_000477 [Candida theae]KAI5967049.1 hypothetical protein KGF57_000477 [Candida theae]